MAGLHNADFCKPDDIGVLHARASPLPVEPRLLGGDANSPANTISGPPAGAGPDACPIHRPMPRFDLGQDVVVSNLFGGRENYLRGFRSELRTDFASCDSAGTNCWAARSQPTSTSSWLPRLL